MENPFPHVLLGLVVVGASAGAAPAERSAAFLLPPGGPAADYPGFARDVADSFALRPEYTLGPGSPDGREVRREGTNVVVAWSVSEGGNSRRVELLQAILAQGSDGNYLVAPERLHRGVELWPDGLLARVVAPPGAFLFRDEPRAAAEELAQSIGVPAGDLRDWSTLALSATDPLRVFEAVAPQVPGIYLACNCTVLTRHASGLSPNLNLVRVVLTSTGDAVAIEITPWIDLAGSNLLPRDEASRAVADALERRGTRIHNLEFSRLDLDFDPARVVNEWQARDSEDRPVSVRQNAHDGTLLDYHGPPMPAQPLPPEGPRGTAQDPSGASRDAPSPPWSALASLVAVAFLSRGRGRGRT